MSKISLIIGREYFTRVRKKSFIVMTILGPMLMALVFMAPIFLAMYEEDEVSRIKVIDETGLFAPRFKDTEALKFSQDTLPLEIAKQVFDAEAFDAILYLPGNFLNNPKSVLLFTAKQADLNLVSAVEQMVQREVEDIKLKAITKEYGMPREELQKAQAEIKINTRLLTDKGDEETHVELSTAIGFLFAFLIYIFIFLYGAQVMRGVIEEKTNRIVEVIISSVKPFELMMGKIIGIALVGLTQFILWIVLTFTISSVATSVLVDTNKIQEQMQYQTTPLGTATSSTLSNPEQQVQMQEGISKAFDMLGSIDFVLIIGAFLFYFIGGYLLYGALFAAIGAAVDGESDTQQFMLPVTMPMVLSFLVAQFVIQNPDGNVAFWFSMIPLTSPVVMMVRIPFGVDTWQVVLSGVLLVAGFVAATFIAGRIYRTGILMYGKKVSWKELGKWLFYKS
ncbi:MAG: ABC transporter permease [Bacteroidia bacterium]